MNARPDFTRATAADTRPAMLWPVASDPFTMRPVHWFDDYYAAVDFVNANQRNFYIGEPRHALTECIGDPLLRKDAA